MSTPHTELPCRLPEYAVILCMSMLSCLSGGVDQIDHLPWVRCSRATARGCSNKRIPRTAVQVSFLEQRMRAQSCDPTRQSMRLAMDKEIVSADGCSESGPTRCCCRVFEMLLYSSRRRHRTAEKVARVCSSGGSGDMRS